MFLAKGASVVMMNRNDVTFVPMDLAVLASVRAAAAVLEQAHYIEAIIGNVAIAQGANQQLTVDGFERQFGVKHFGHLLLY